MVNRGIGKAGGVDVLLKVAKLGDELDMGGGVGTEYNQITFDKETDEVVLIYAADILYDHLNGLGTGTEVNTAVSLDDDQITVEMNDDATIFYWNLVKSFVTSGMQILAPHQLKSFSYPLITSKPQVTVVSEVTTSTWANGALNVYLFYTTRKLDAEARRVLIGTD